MKFLPDRHISAVFFLMLCLGLARFVVAQEPAVPDTTISVEALRQQQQQAEAGIEDEQLKARLTELYELAVDQLNRSTILEKRLASFQDAKSTAEQRVADMRRQLENQGEAPVIDGTLPLAQLEQQLVQAEADSKQLNQDLSDINDLVAARTARRKQIRDRLLETQRLLDAIENTRTILAPGESPEFSAAHRMERLTRERLIKAETAALDAELEAIEAEDVLDLPRIRRDLLTKQLTLATRVSEALQVAVSRQREADAQAQIESTKNQVSQVTDPILQILAQRNVELAEHYQSLTKLIKQVESELAKAVATRDKISAESESARQKVKAIGRLTDAIGSMLRKQKRSLPGKREFLQDIRERSERIGSSQLVLLELEEERGRDVDRTLIRIAEQANTPALARPSPEIHEQAKSAIARRNELLTPLIRAQSEYFDSLVEVSNTEQQIVNKIDDFERFIDKLVLWVRSSKPLFLSLDFKREDFWLLSPRRWKDAGQRLFMDFSVDWFWYVVGGLALAGLLHNRFAFRRRIRGFGEAALSNACISFRPTIATLGLTFIAALPWPALIAFLSWRCSLVSGDNDVLKALSNGLYCAAAGYYPLDFFRLACKPHGLVEAHFGWSGSSVQLVRRTIRAFTLLGLPLVLLSTLMSSGIHRLGRDTFERIPFITITIALAFFVSRLFHPRTGVFRDYLARHPNGWPNRLQALWYWALIFGPVMLAGLAFFGFYYTAQQLAWRLFVTACLLGTLLIITAVSSRLLWVQRRRLSIEQSRKRREAQLKASQDPDAVLGTLELPTAADLRAQVQQSRSLLQTMMVGVALLAVWFTWVDVLPALSFLEQWPLWHSTKQVTEMVTSETGDEIFRTREVLDKITISDVAFALFVLALTTLSARNIPGVLEISILQRLPIEASVRYAITTIVSYLIVLFGIVVACNAIGIHWNQIQWMATALTFGLAFGLQEMFANFVAGIIILFERPIRVGDIVTIDDVTGKVSRVQIRATTITNWDRKDYIVPNKDFITGRVLNWTLSDQVNRIVINVGLAYGSDKDLALKTLHSIAAEHLLIVEDPGPIVTFEGFGESTLDFVLRCYIAMKDMPSRLQVVHDLHTEIDDAFRELNLEIAFPQQDIHVRTVTKQIAT